MARGKRSPEAKQRMREAKLRLLKDPNWKTKHPNWLWRKGDQNIPRGFVCPKGVHLSPRTEFKKGDPRMKELQLKARAAVKHHRTSKPERALQNAMKEAQIDFIPNKFLLVPRCEPDAVIENGKLAIFCDGDYWHRRPEVIKRDTRINADLEANGWTVIRFWEHEVNEDITRCVAVINEVLGA